MKNWAFKIFDWVMLILTAIIVILAIFFSLMRLFIPHLSNYQNRIQTWASSALHEPVQIGQMTAVWRGIGPELEFRQVEILNQAATRPIFKVNKLIVGIDIIESLLKWRFEPGWIIVEGANIAVHQDQNGNININGYSTQIGSTQNSKREFIKWLLDQEKIFIKDVNVTWFGKDGKIIPFKDIKIKFTQGLFSSELLGSAVADVASRPTSIHTKLNLSGDIVSQKNYTVKFNAYLKNLSLPFWLEHRLNNFTINNGDANLVLNGEWNQNGLQNLQTEYYAKDLNIASKYFLRPLNFAHAAGNVTWERNAQGWNVTADKMYFKEPHLFWPEVSWSLQNFAAQNSTPAKQIFRSDALSINEVKDFLFNTTFLSAENNTRLTQINPSGYLKNFSLTHTGDEWNLDTISFQTQFAQLNWNAWQKIPGAKNLYGSINYTPNQGTLTLNARNTVWDFNNLFRYPLPIDTINGTIQWEKSNTGTNIQSDDLVLENTFAYTKTNFNLLLPINHTSPIIKLQSALNLADPVTAVRYQPVGILPKKVVEWLDKAFVSGHSATGNMTLNGALADFPYDNNKGQFLIDSQVNDITLHYHDGWPDIKHINGELIFNDNSMTVNAKTGQIFNANLANTQAVIKDMRKPVLTVVGTASGDLSDGLNFLQQSPLNESIGKRMEGFVMHGPMNLNLQLTIPFSKEPNQINGNLIINNGSLTIPQWFNIQLQKINGKLNFTHDTLAGELQTHWFNQPLNINISTLNPGTKTSITQFDLGNGSLPLLQISERFQLPQFPYVSGILNYRALLQFSDNVKSANQLIVQTDLNGIGIDLPQPLGKSIQEKIPSQLNIIFNDKNRLNLLVTYDKRLSAALTFAKDLQNKMNLLGGMISLGGRKATFTNERGLIVNGYLPQFALSDWEPYFKDKAGQNKTAFAPSLLKSLDVTFGTFSGFGLTLSQIEIQLQSELRGWEVGLNNQNMQGKILIPHEYPRGVVVANFQRLNFSMGKQVTQTPINPASVPALNFTCQSCQYGNKNFGFVQIRATPTKDSLLLDNINVRSSNINLNMQGRWQGNNNYMQTHIDGRFTTQNLGSVLQDWGLTHSLVGGNGSADFSLSWNGAPFHPSLNSLYGNMNMNFGDGRIVNLSSSAETELGLGTILNLFSLQSIPRRLRLDFSDLTDAGFSFDVMAGSFNLRQGNAYTDNTYLDGPVAKVAITGRIGLATKDYDTTLQVTPYAASDIPTVAATVAGGPIVGAITWVASKILSRAVSEFTTYSYQVTGSWGNPNITQVQQQRGGQ